MIASTTTQSCESAGSTQGPEFVRRSKEMAERDVQASHRLGPILVTLAGDRAIEQLVTIIDIPFKLEGIEVMLSSHTRLLLRAERREGVWRLSGFDPVYLRDEIAPVIPGQTVAVDPEAVKAFRPSYRLLSYCAGSAAGRSSWFVIGATPAADSWRMPPSRPRASARKPSYCPCR